MRSFICNSPHDARSVTVYAKNTKTPETIARWYCRYFARSFPTAPQNARCFREGGVKRYRKYVQAKQIRRFSTNYGKREFLFENSSRPPSPRRQEILMRVNGKRRSVNFRSISYSINTPGRTVYTVRGRILVRAFCERTAFRE